MNMDYLEEYIKRNREAFDDQGLPEGDLERFVGRLEILRFAQDDSQVAQDDSQVAQDDKVGVKASHNATTPVGGKWRRLSKRFVYWTAGVAAALAAVIFINKNVDLGGDPGVAEIDWFAGIGTDQAMICQTYYSKASELYSAAIANDIDGSAEREMASMFEGQTTLLDLLPDEMTPEARAVVLKEYYGTLLDGMQRINELNIKY